VDDRTEATLIECAEFPTSSGTNLATAAGVKAMVKLYKFVFLLIQLLWTIFSVFLASRAIAKFSSSLRYHSP